MDSDVSTCIILVLKEAKFLAFLIGTRFVDPPPFFNFFNSSLLTVLWDVFIIKSVEQLQTLPKTQSEAAAGNDELYLAS